MDRLASHLFLATLLSVSLAACGDDTSAGGGTDTDTDTGTAGSSTGDPGGTNTSSPGTSAGTVGADSGSSGLDSSGGPGTTGPDPTTGPGTTTGVDQCEECVTTNCGDVIAECLADPTCECWFDCLEAGNEFPTCGMKCMEMPPGELFAIPDCIDSNCDAECNGGGSGGGGMGQTYDPCAGNGDCDMGLECNMFLGYCSIDCMGDDMACPDPATGTASPICGGMSDNCVLPCGGGGGPPVTCPDGMSCQAVGGGGFELCLPN